MMGRPRKPTANLVGWRARLPERVAELRLEPRSADSPSCLTGEARREWRRAIAPLVEQGIIADADVAGAIALCQAWARYVEASADVAARGSVIRSKNGPIQNPHLRIARDALGDYLKLAPQFGILPANRSRVAAAGDEAKGKGDKARFFRTAG